MSTKKIIAIFGVTGKQGGSVVARILEDPVLKNQYSLRGITRDVSKPAAVSLEKQGVELHSANLDDKPSLRAALEGSSIVFLVTSYWELLSGEREMSQGKNVADVCKELGVERLIASTLMSIKDISSGKYAKVEHFESKYAIEEYVRAQGIPATFVLAGFYSSNFRFMPDKDGVQALTLNGPADAKIPVVNTDEDYGKFVVGVLHNLEKTLGMRVLASGGYVTPKEVVAAYERATEKPAKYTQVDDATMLAILGGNEERLENMQMMFDPTVGYYGGASLEPSLALLKEKPVTLEDAFKRHATARSA